MKNALIARADPSRPRFPWYVTLSLDDAKLSRGDDGCLYIRDVVGTSETLDRDGEVVDYLSAKACMADFMNRTSRKSGPLREQHTQKVAGRVIGWKPSDDDKAVKIDLKIIADDAIKLVENGGYTGVSIGFRRAFKVGNRLVVKRIGEFSLVDAEANPDSALPLEKAEGDDTRKGLGLVSYFIGLLQNLLMVRDSLQAERAGEGDKSETPEAADALARDAAELAREMFEEEVAEALGDMDEDEATAGQKKLAEFSGELKAKESKLGETGVAVRKALNAAMDSYEQAVKRQKEAPVENDAEKAVRLETELKAANARIVELETEQKAVKDGGMSGDHKRHAKAFVAMHKSIGDHLKEHEKAMHPSVHKDFSAAHKAAAPHAEHAAKMLDGHKEAGETFDLDTFKSLLDEGIAKAVKPLNDKIATLEAQPAPHPLGGPGDPVPAGRKGVRGNAVLDLKSMDLMARSDQAFGDAKFVLLYSLARAGLKVTDAAPQGG